MVQAAESGRARHELSIVSALQVDEVAPVSQNGAVDMTSTWEALPRQARVVMATFASPTTPVENFPDVFQAVLAQHSGNLHAVARSISPDFPPATIWKMARRLDVTTRTLSDSLRARWDDPNDKLHQVHSDPNKIQNFRKNLGESKNGAVEPKKKTRASRKNAVIDKAPATESTRQIINAPTGDIEDFAANNASVDLFVQPAPGDNALGEVDIFIDALVRVKKLESPKRLWEVLTEEEFQDIGGLAVQAYILHHATQDAS